MNKEFDIKNNSINTLRFLAAFQVMWGHLVEHFNVNFPRIGGNIAIDEILSWLLYFFLGVPLFFFISGFLIWISIDKYRSSKNYYINRFLRIYPELWIGIVVEIVCLIIFIVPINWKDLIAFTWSQATILQFWTPSSLRSFGCGTPNGSLWTICVMIQFYIIVWPMKRLLCKRKLSFWIIFEMFLMAIGAATKYVEVLVPEVIYKLYCQTVVQYMWIFCLGIIVAEYKELILPKLIKYWYIFAIGAIIMRFSPIDIWSRGFPIVLSCFCLTALLGLSYKLPEANIKLDVSYALFIYHMIVANVMIELGYIANAVAFFVCILVSLILAYLSTVLIGRNVSRLKVQ